MGFCLPPPHRYSKYHNGCPLHARTPRRALLEEERKGLFQGVLRERHKQLWSANLLYNFCFVLKRMMKRFPSVKKMLAFYSEITLHVKFCLDFFSSYCTFVFHEILMSILIQRKVRSLPPNNQHLLLMHSCDLCCGSFPPPLLLPFPLNKFSSRRASKFPPTSFVLLPACLVFPNAASANWVFSFYSTSSRCAQRTERKEEEKRREAKKWARSFVACFSSWPPPLRQGGKVGVGWLFCGGGSCWTLVLIRQKKGYRRTRPTSHESLCNVQHAVAQLCPCLPNQTRFPIKTLKKSHSQSWVQA